jgi:hypothetical protein
MQGFEHSYSLSSVITGALAFDLACCEQVSNWAKLYNPTNEGETEPEPSDFRSMISFATNSLSLYQLSQTQDNCQLCEYALRTLGYLLRHKSIASLVTQEEARTVVLLLVETVRLTVHKVEKHVC